MAKKITVIGSGFGGLAAALRLKAKGHKVTLVEKHPDLGGRARVFKKDQFIFDGGPTVITAPYLFEELFSLSLIINDNSNDIQQFTRKLNENLDYDEKLEIIEMMWKIIIADGRIDDYENSLIRKISGLLYVQDSDVGKIKNKY